MPNWWRVFKDINARKRPPPRLPWRVYKGDTVMVTYGPDQGIVSALVLLLTCLIASGKVGKITKILYKKNLVSVEGSWFAVLLFRRSIEPPVLLLFAFVLLCW